MAARRLSDVAKEIAEPVVNDPNPEVGFSLPDTSGDEFDSVPFTMPPPEKRRFSISGDVDGYPVQVHFYDSDFFSPVDIEDILPPEGSVQYAATMLKRLGVFPRGMSNGNSGVAAASPNNSQAWECPVHGSQRLVPNKFNKSGQTMSCNMWSPTPQPWAPKPFTMRDGKTVYYCQNQEPYDRS